MKNLIGFIVESSVVNLLPILLAAALSAFLAGLFLFNAGLNAWVRGCAYSLIGALASLVSYSYLDIPDRSIEFGELALLFVGMFFLSMLFVMPSIALRSRFRSSKRSAKKG